MLPACTFSACDTPGISRHRHPHVEGETCVKLLRLFFLTGKGFNQEFFVSRPQYGILETEILGQIASFERRFRGAPPTPARPALSVPHLDVNERGYMEPERDKRGVRKFLFFQWFSRFILGILMYGVVDVTKLGKTWAP